MSKLMFGNPSTYPHSLSNAIDNDVIETLYQLTAFYSEEEDMKHFFKLLKGEIPMNSSNTAYTFEIASGRFRAHKPSNNFIPSENPEFIVSVTLTKQIFYMVILILDKDLKNPGCCSYLLDLEIGEKKELNNLSDITKTLCNLIAKNKGVQLSSQYYPLNN